MPSAIIEKDFSKMLRALGRANRTGKQAALKAEAACTQLNLHGKIQLPRTYHGETRMNCEKYDLGDGYRLITQLAGAGPDQKVVMMFVGSHDDADAWLKRHKNYTWVMQNSDGKVEFIQVTVPEGERPHAQVEVSIDTPEHVLDESLLSLASDQDLAQGHFSEPATVILKGITKGDWGERSDNLIDAIESSDGTESALLALDLLTMADRGDIDGVRQRLQLSADKAHQATTTELARAITEPANVETFFTWDEPADLPDPSNREDWMLYLHPDQAKIAGAALSGPARLRGVSGSGKTCVLVHRARHLAKNYGEPVLIVTLTESMRKLLESLIISLCGAERSLITTSTVANVAREVIRQLHPQDERWFTMADTLRDSALDKAVDIVQSSIGTGTGTPRLSSLSKQDMRKFLEAELSYIRMRLLPAEYGDYTTPGFKRVGRGQALSESGRQLVHKGLMTYEQYLRDLHRLDHEAVVQVAVELLTKLGSGHPGYRWRSVLADEVQDLSQNEIRMLSQIHTVAAEPLKTAPDGLFLVGDGAQTIYRRGFSLQSLGIQLTRSHVFKKNYRNTYEILQAAYGLIRDYEFADVDEDNRQRPQTPDYAARRGDRPVMARCRGMRDEVAYAVSVVEATAELDGDAAISEICVISRSRTIREQVTAALQSKGLACTDIRDGSPVDAPGVRVSTVESAKGFEFRIVILAGVSERNAPLRAGGNVESDPGSDAAKLYVAMTRARDVLHITYTSSNDWRPAEALNSISEYCVEVRVDNGRVAPIRPDLDTRP